jgi:GntR family transcriptional regulator, rspAB operon transcriptional repressor
VADTAVASGSSPALRLVKGKETTRSADAYATLRQAVLTLRLGPGTSFSEADACAWLGLSKAPVRDALANLRREGLVLSAARSGYTVAPMTVKDARDLFTLRTLLESEAAALAAGQGGDLARLRELDSLCRSEYDVNDADSVRRFLAVNSAFHVAVAELGGNLRLVEQLRRVIEQLERYMHLGLRLAPRADAIVHEHRELLAAIAAGDVKRARLEAAAQAHESHRMVLDGLLSSEAVLTANIGSNLVGGA